MSRIARAFTSRFNHLLAEFGARDREKATAWLFRKSEQLAAREQISLSHALARQNAELARKLRHFRHPHAPPTPLAQIRIICDAGLGGLARWLRAVGCETHFIPDIHDAELVRKAMELNALIITTDSFLLDRRLITSGEVDALWVPPTLKIHEQLQLVLAELGLSPEPSRCMKCGGELRPVDKESVKERIPPKTYRWVDDYFECSRCGKLYWHGTHWQHIQQQLRASAAVSR